MAHAWGYRPPSSNHVVGLSVVVLLHLLLGWALVTGLATRVVQVITAPVKVALLEEPRKPPPPEPEPLPQPDLPPPPPAFVPPPEVRIKPPPKPPPVITTTPVPPPKPAPVHIAPPPAPLPAPPAPPPPPPKRVNLSRPARIDVSRCSRPEYPPMAVREEATGLTRIRFQVDATGRVVSSTVTHRSGHDRAHRMLDRAAVQALSRCRFTPGRNAQGQPIGGSTSVEYLWRLD